VYPPHLCHPSPSPAARGGCTALFQMYPEQFGSTPNRRRFVASRVCCAVLCCNSVRLLRYVPTYRICTSTYRFVCSYNGDSRNRGGVAVFIWAKVLFVMKRETLHGAELYCKRLFRSVVCERNKCTQNIGRKSTINETSWGM
jgi:hypothetical protein